MLNYVILFVKEFWLVAVACACAQFGSPYLFVGSIAGWSGAPTSTKWLKTSVETRRRAR